MNVLRYTVLLLLLFVSAPLKSLGHDVRIPMIIDMDCALDDMRSLILLLQSGHADLLAVVASDGSASPAMGARNIARVLSEYDISGVLIGTGRELSVPAPPWRPMSDSLGWSGIEPYDSGDTIVSAVDAILNALSIRDDKVTYICLGPLTNLADALRTKPSLLGRIDAIYYSDSPPGSDEHCWNTKRDEESAHLVLRSGIPFFAVYLNDSELLRFDEDMLHDIYSIESTAGRLLTELHEDDRVLKLVKNGHFRTWDETVALLIIDPTIATLKETDAMIPLYTINDWDSDKSRDAYLDAVAAIPPRIPVIFETFPSDPAQMRNDVRPFVDSLIEKHGYEEWKAAVITNEFHRHLGMYSLIGAKMGIRAREILEASLDDLEVISYTGLEPPISCLIDGLQAATGASLGRGSINVVGDDPKPAAEFVMKGRRLRLVVKESVVKTVRETISELKNKHGGFTPLYYTALREYAIDFWVNQDRKEIFEETLVTE